MNNEYLENLIIFYLKKSCEPYLEPENNNWLINDIADLLFKDERPKFDTYYSVDIDKINQYILEKWGTLDSESVKKIILRNRKLNKLGI